eukprot:1754506-Pleurochrysis_carterae.AAC.1
MGPDCPLMTWPSGSGRSAPAAAPAAARARANSRACESKSPRVREQVAARARANRRKGSRRLAPDEATRRARGGGARAPGRARLELCAPRRRGA